MENQTYTFYFYFDESWQKIELADNQNLELSCGGVTDEGHHYEHTMFYRRGNFVTRRDHCDDLDCDGKTSYYVELIVDITKPLLDTRDNEYGHIDVPSWKKIDESCRDFTAESMGY